MVTSTGVLLIVIGGTVEASVTLNEWSPSRASSSMIDTIAHAMSSFPPGVNAISSEEAAEKSSPITIHIKKEKVGSGHVIQAMSRKMNIGDLLMKSALCKLCSTPVCIYTTYIPALVPLTRVRVATRGQPNPPEGRSVTWAQHICVTPTFSLTGTSGAISEIVASVGNSNLL